VSSTASAVPLGQGGPEASASGPTLTTMLDHLGVPCDDVDTSLSFYTAVFAPLGVHEVVRFPHEGSAVVGLAGADGVPHLWLAPGGPARAEIHLALTAPDRAAVARCTRPPSEQGRRCCTRRGSGRTTTPATTACSCATRTGTTPRPCTTAEWAYSSSAMVSGSTPR